MLKSLAAFECVSTFIGFRLETVLKQLFAIVNQWLTYYYNCQEVIGTSIIMYIMFITMFKIIFQQILLFKRIYCINSVAELILTGKCFPHSEDTIYCYAGQLANTENLKNIFTARSYSKTSWYKESPKVLR